MLKNFISKLKYSSLKEDKIKAFKLPLNELDAYLFFDYKKQLHLIIKSEDSITENRKGIKVINRVLDIIDYGEHQFIDIVCLHKDFQNEFIQIAEQIIEHYHLHKDLNKAIKIIINKWYYFFEKQNDTDLSESEIIGLLGELLFVQNISLKLSFREIFDSWKGPESGLRDFNFNIFDVEVKASSKEIGHVHTINGQIQLKSDEIPLYIYSVSLKKSDSKSSLTIKKLVDKICLSIGDNSFLLNDFFQKLEKIKVLVNKTEKYNHYSYELQNILIIKIDKTNVNNFLVKNDNTRISRLKYDYDFNGLKNCEIEME